MVSCLYGIRLSVVIKALRNNVDMFSDLGSIIKDCKSLLAHLQNLLISFIRWSTNMVAHNFAKAYMLYPDYVFSMGDVLTDLLLSLVTEFNN